MKIPFVSFRRLYTLALIFTLSFLLSYCLTVPAMAGEDDCGSANGAGVWVALDDPELGGPSHFHIKVGCNGDDRGFVYVGGWPSPGDWFVVGIEDAVVMHSDEMISQPGTDPPFPPAGTWWASHGDIVTGPAVWAYGPVTSTNVEWLTDPGTDWVLLGAYDSGPHGQNKDDFDYLVAYAGIAEADASWFFNQIKAGVQWVPYVVFLDKGNNVVKMK